MEAIERELFYYRDIEELNRDNPTDFQGGEIFPLPDSPVAAVPPDEILGDMAPDYRDLEVASQVIQSAVDIFSQSMADPEENSVVPSVEPWVTGDIFNVALESPVDEMPRVSQGLGDSLSAPSLFFPKGESVTAEDEVPTPVGFNYGSYLNNTLTSPSDSQVHIHNEIPAVNIEFSGSIDREVDVEALMRDIQQRLSEEIASGSDFAYSF